MDELDIEQVKMYQQHAREIEYRRLYGAVIVRREVARVGLFLAGGGKLPNFKEEFPTWAYSKTLPEPTKPYSPELAAAFKAALKAGRVSNAMLSRLGTERLRLSGVTL